MPPIIELKNISKCYKLGSIGSGSLRQDMSRFFNKKSRHEPDTNEFWALRDISFEVQKGEVLGIIGHNGAGKSTLLKILSRITDPNTGEAKLRGRVASLLEVGTGFHPELTGRENIYLNGATLGMRKSEIDSKLDEIVDFSGCEKFIDTPVKRYSSGMTVRLGFAVAAHLEPEILIIDEVLAVGDIAFQEKCLGKMKDVAGHGKTVLFVSHQMVAVENLCSRSILLEKGRIHSIGNTSDIIDNYRKLVLPSSNNEVKLIKRTDRSGSGNIKVSEITTFDKHKQASNSIEIGEELLIKIKFKIENKTLNYGSLRFDLGIDSDSHQRIAFIGNQIVDFKIDSSKLENEGLNIHIQSIPLLPGKYKFTVFLANDEEILDWIVAAHKISINESDFYKTGRLPQKAQGDLVLSYKYLN
jgi:lipopolysaccharide transport system ATP-binding protein